MDDRRYQVFVSSTFLDLQEERAAVVSSLLQMDAFPAGMELFPAADDDAWTLIQRVIDSSDYYLLVVGGKYGSVDPETQISYTEKEFDYAVTQKKPVMAFLHAAPEELKLKDSEKDEEARAKLDAFRTKVTDTKHVKFWNGPEDLAGKVALSFAKFRQTYPAVGWIRGDVQTSTEALKEVNELRKRLAEKEAELGTVRSGPPPEAAGLAQGRKATNFATRIEAMLQTRKHPDAWSPAKYSGTFRPEITWDDLFGCVGPILLDEAEESAIAERIEEWLTQRFARDLREIVNSGVEKVGDTLRQIRSSAISLSADDFGTFIVQMRALGLITKSQKSRSVKDTNTYWTLTPYGDAHLTTLRAIRDRDDSPAALPDESTPTEQPSASKAAVRKPKPAKKPATAKKPAR